VFLCYIIKCNNKAVGSAGSVLKNECKLSLHLFYIYIYIRDMMTVNGHEINLINLIIN
jgi:hypothetical protein